MIPDGQLARYFHRAMIFGAATTVLAIIAMRLLTIPGPFLLTGCILVSGVHLLCADVAARRANDRWANPLRHKR